MTKAGEVFMKELSGIAQKELSRWFSGDSMDFTIEGVTVRFNSAGECVKIFKQYQAQDTLWEK